MNNTTTESGCLICQRIEQIKNGDNPYFITELKTGYAVFGDYQFYPGYSLFLSKIHAEELHDLTFDFKKQFLLDMSYVAEALHKIFQPSKLNYELLGNKDRHLHWHIYPRYEDDPDPNRPIWSYPKEKRCNKDTEATAEFITSYGSRMKVQIEELARKSEEKHD